MDGAGRVLGALVITAVAGCAFVPIGQEAPERCGFPAGTALSYAGRSTTAALGVQEVVGDPMSDDPADIYVTRDAIDQGDHRGRLVCAIYVNPDFVEITVHPDDIEPVVVTPEPAARPEPPTDISREDAIVAARDAVAGAETWEVVSVNAGPLWQILPDWQADHNDWARDLSPELWVWRVNLWDGEYGADVIVDFVDGSVHGVSEWVSELTDDAITAADSPSARPEPATGPLL